MSATGYYAQRFSEALASERPALAKFLLSPPRGKSGWLEIFEVSRPGHEGQSLLVVDRDDTIEIAWRGLPTRGPAEFHWIEKKKEDEELVRSAVSAVISILEGQTTAMIRRYRFLWFRPWYLAWFRQPGRPLEPAVVEEVRWNQEGPNQTPEPTTTSVTSRAPSSTSRAGCGRGSS